MLDKTKSQLWWKNLGWVALIGLLAGVACTPKLSSSPPDQPKPQPTASAARQPTFNLSPSPAPSPRPSVQPGLAPPSPSPVLTLPGVTAPIPTLCSPLQGLALTDLPGAVTNPFAPPAFGSDDPHQGVDFSDRLAGSQLAVEGRPVQAVLSGQVSGVIANRFPYGNAILVETPIGDLPPGLDLAILAPWPGGSFPTPAVRSALTCPPWSGPASTGRDVSLYLLYAHMQQPPALEPGSSVACGSVLGAVGSSGNALNPHLHLEARIGPAGVKFDSMAHYDTNATGEEMANYCAWRTSGAFIPINPLQLLPASP